MSGTAFISTTIPYINARPHLGHALEYVQADAYARQMAQMGRDVMFLSGSDENSLKNVLAAEKAGLSAREFVDQHVVYFEELIARLGLRVDRFVRTSIDPDHLNGAAEIWNRMRASDDIYAKEYEGLYCVGCEQFYAPADLAGGLCPDHLTAPEVVKERNYFFRLSRYGERFSTRSRLGKSGSSQRPGVTRSSASCPAGWRTSVFRDRCNARGAGVSPFRVTRRRSCTSGSMR
jgi:methionyl-tRNA synthetase